MNPAQSAQIPTDQELVAQTLRGDERAFAEFYSRYSPVLCRRLRRVLGKPEDVEDVLQMTFVEIYRSLPRYRPELPLGPWMHGISFRVTANFLRSRKRRSWQKPEFEGEIQAAPDTTGVSTENQVLHRQLMGLLFCAMEQLKPKKRIAYALYELDGMGYTEIGQMLDASPQTIRARVLSARKVVQRRLSHLRKQIPARASQVVEQKS